MEPSEDFTSDYAGRFLETNILDKNPFLTREDGPITKCIRIHKNRENFLGFLYYKEQEVSKTNGMVKPASANEQGSPGQSQGPSIAADQDDQADDERDTSQSSAK